MTIALGGLAIVHVFCQNGKKPFLKDLKTVLESAGDLAKLVGLVMTVVKVSPSNPTMPFFALSAITTTSLLSPSTTKMTPIDPSASTLLIGCASQATIVTANQSTWQILGMPLWKQAQHTFQTC